MKIPSLQNMQSIAQPEILLVDDSPEQIEPVVAVLQDNNYRVRIATKGSTALKLLAQHQPDLILLDIYMPEMDGFEVCKKIKANSNYNDIPIIFFTASNDEQSIKHGFELGAQDYVVKPFTASELIARVNTHIKIKQQAESIRQAYRELDSFCYSVSHDLKVPLLSINQLIRFLFSDYANQLDAEGKELIHHIHDKSKETITIIDRLLEFARVCDLQMHRQTIDLNKIFMEVYHELMSIHPNRRVDFNLCSLPNINGDPVMMKLLILNILSNCFKYTSQRETAVIDVTLSTNEKECIIAVKDNGAGFDMRYSSRLFGVFQRLHSQNEFEGSGVGLAISKKILDKHNGRAWLVGEIDQGAVFYFTLPKDIIIA